VRAPTRAATSCSQARRTAHPNRRQSPNERRSLPASPVSGGSCPVTKRNALRASWPEREASSQLTTSPANSQRQNRSFPRRAVTRPGEDPSRRSLPRRPARDGIAHEFHACDVSVYCSGVAIVVRVQLGRAHCFSFVVLDRGYGHESFPIGAQNERRARSDRRSVQCADGRCVGRQRRRVLGRAGPTYDSATWIIQAHKP
jgi:hypothetical protein